jgi:hypothetical protein
MKRHDTQSWKCGILMKVEITTEVPGPIQVESASASAVIHIRIHALIWTLLVNLLLSDSQSSRS